MKKRYLTMVLAAAMVMSSVLAGCGGQGGAGESESSGDTQEEGGSSAEESEGSGERQTITFYKQDGGNGAVEALIDAFNESQDKYTAEWVIAPKDSGDVRSQLNTAFGAGSSDYDVVCIDTVWAGDMAGAGYLEPLDSI